MEIEDKHQQRILMINTISVKWQVVEMKAWRKGDHYLLADEIVRDSRGDGGLRPA